MSKRILFILILLFHSASFSQSYLNSDTLYKVCRDESNPIVPFFPNCGYATKNGDTLVSVGKYIACFSDEFVNFAVVLTDTSSSPIAVNREGGALFQVFWLSGDGWPDDLSDGMIRIVENGKIGYANSLGEIIIEPKYDCASRFNKGIARVSFRCSIEEIDEEHSRNISEEWIFIDLKGNTIN